MFKVGIIGGGRIARLHGPLVLQQPDVRLVGIADRDVTRGRTLATALNGVSFYKDPKTLIEEQRPDIVHVLTPPQSHAELSILAMDHGCHVLVEKPMALTVAEAEKMVQVARENNVRLCVDHNLVFDDAVRQVRRFVAEGLIGDVVSVEATYLYDPRRSPGILDEGAEYCHWAYDLNGGPLEDHMTHPASLVMEFIPEIEEMQWLGTNRGVLPKGWDDEIRVLIKGGGILGVISMSLSERPDTIAVTVKGTRSIIQADLFNNIVTLQRRSGLPRALDRGLSGFRLCLQYLKGSVSNIYKFARGQIDRSGGIEPIISKFYEAVRTGGDPPVSVDKSLQIVHLMNQIWPVPLGRPLLPQRVAHAVRTKQHAPTTLVTGASGFIGVHLVNKLLEEGVKVRAFVRPNSIHAGRLKKYDVDIAEGDLADAESVLKAAEGIRTIYHAGASMSDDWDEHYQSTIKGTENAVNAALAHQVERFLHISSIAVYGLDGLKRNSVVGEDSPYPKDPKRLGAYVYSKIEAEKLVFDAYRKHGLGVTLVRPGIVVGPLGRVFFPHLGYRYQDRIFVIVGKGNTILPLTYVDNTVDAIFLASIADRTIGQIYNLIDDCGLTVRDYLERFREITSKDVRVITLPYLVPYLATAAYETAAYCGLLKKGLTSRAQLRRKHKCVYFDNSSAKNGLGWTPKIAIDDALRQTMKWHAAQYR